MTDGSNLARRNKLIANEAILNQQVATFFKSFTALENALADLLHAVVFPKNVHADSRIAHAIYFAPDSFGPRLAIVDRAITEWLDENPIGAYRFDKLWSRLHGRLGTLRETRNTIAHGAVRTLFFDGTDEMYTRVVPPTYSPRLGNLVRDKKVPGRTAREIRNANVALALATTGVLNVSQVIEYHEEGEPTWKQTYDGLEFHLTQLDSSFPIFLKTQVQIGQPEPSPE